jgi:hypothetical protein
MISKLIKEPNAYASNAVTSGAPTMSALLLFLELGGRIVATID